MEHQIKQLKQDVKNLRELLTFSIDVQRTMFEAMLHFDVMTGATRGALYSRINEFDEILKQIIEKQKNNIYE